VPNLLAVTLRAGARSVSTKDLIPGKGVRYMKRFFYTQSVAPGIVVVADGMATTTATMAMI
jgi:hypothetical protein